MRFTDQHSSAAWWPEGAALKHNLDNITLHPQRHLKVPKQEIPWTNNPIRSPFTNISSLSWRQVTDNLDMMRFENMWWDMITSLSSETQRGSIVREFKIRKSAVLNCGCPTQITTAIPPTFLRGIGPTTTDECANLIRCRGRCTKRLIRRSGESFTTVNEERKYETEVIQQFLELIPATRYNTAQRSQTVGWPQYNFSCKQDWGNGIENTTTDNGIWKPCWYSNHNRFAKATKAKRTTIRASMEFLYLLPCKDVDLIEEGLRRLNIPTRLNRNRFIIHVLKHATSIQLTWILN